MLLIPLYIIMLLYDNMNMRLGREIKSILENHPDTLIEIFPDYIMVYIKNFITFQLVTTFYPMIRATYPTFYYLNPEINLLDIQTGIKDIISSNHPNPLTCIIGMLYKKYIDVSL
jgi:hypothetical protein